MDGTPLMPVGEKEPMGGKGREGVQWIYYTLGLAWILKWTKKIIRHNSTVRKSGGGGDEQKARQALKGGKCMPKRGGGTTQCICTLKVMENT